MAKRILIVSDCPTLNTGYARVSRFVATALQNNGYRVRYLPCNATVEHSDRSFNFEMEKFDPNQRYNNHRIGEVLTNYKPALVMVFGEFSFVGYIGNVCMQFNIQSLYYCPVEGEGYPPKVVYLSGGHIDYKLTMMKFHHIVAYSQFGARNINNLLPGIVTDTIPHQVDNTVFRPLSREACLDMFFPQLLKNPDIGMDKLTIIGGVFRNMRRKGADYFMNAIGHLIRDHEKFSDKKYYAFLITDPRDGQGFNLETLIDKHGLKGRVVLHPVIGGKEGPNDHQLCEIYNTFDVMLAPHRAEGFGVPILEACACGIRVVTTNYATPAEFGKEVFTFVDPEWLEPVHGTNCEWAVIDAKKIAEKVAVVCTSNNTKETYQKGVDLANTFSEDNVTKKWLQLINDLDLPDVADIDEESFKVPTDSDIADSYLEALD